MNAPQKPAISVAELEKKIGQEIGVSQWHVVSQEMIDRFADVTSDHQFIHVDPARAKKETPFGGTIAHGYLTLSLLAPMGYEALPQIEGRVMGINYGLDKVRFLTPVRAGKRVRARYKLKEVTRRSDKEVLLKNEVTVEIEGGDKPAVYAESLSVIVLQ
ncbi:MAG TPA: MaoC family dehydratase [Xanthobacteraceae bacterium]|nr:MaoC family dehydratase [Xanthobacteraceae bacterium]